MASERHVLQLFAGLAELAGQSRLDTSLDAATTAQDLLERLARDYPALGPLLRRTRVAVDARFIGAADRVLPAREIALIPPVSGG